MDKDKGIPRHASVATSTPRQLAWRWFRTLRWRLLLHLLSDFGRDLILRRKWDAFICDRAYENRASGKFLVGKAIDRFFLNKPFSENLRHRLKIVVSELESLATDFEAQGEAPVRIVSGPCGLARDLILVGQRLKRKGPLAGRVEFWGVDLDSESDALPEALRRAKEADLELNVMQADLLRPDKLLKRFEGKPVHVFNSIGITSWIDSDELSQLFGMAKSLLSPGGAMVVDLPREPPKRGGGDFEISRHYHSRDELEESMDNSGFQIQRRQETPSGASAIYTATLVS